MNACASLRAFHAGFIISWFAGPSYLPRIYVNRADVENAPMRERLLLMSRKLVRFMTGLGFLTVGFGILLWGGYAVGKNAGWLQAKLALMLGLVMYHAHCALRYQRIAGDGSTRSHVWFRWVNEVPVLTLIAIVALAVGKPS